MKKFLYKITTTKGEQVQNTILAESISDAAVKLEQKGYTILEITELQQNSYCYEGLYISKQKEFTLQEKKEFFNAFYHMYKAGVSVVETFCAIYRSSANSNIRNFCSLIIRKVEKGNSLRETLRNYSMQLGIAYTMLIAAGEESGKLEDTISGILKNLKKQEELKASLISALTYPAILSCMTLVVGLFFKFFILKIFKKVAEYDTDYNIVSILIFAIIKIIIVFVIITGICIYIYKDRTFSGFIKNRILKIKIFGNIVKNFYFANFFYVMSLAYDAGIPILEAHIMANSIVTIPACFRKLKKSADMVQNACKLSTALAATDLFSSYALSQISAGEEAGELGKMFKSIAFDYENKLDLAIQVMKKLIEPAFMIIIGIVIGSMVVIGYKSYLSALTYMF